MIQTTRKHLFGLAARVSICFALVTGFSVRADAQFGVEDFLNLAQNITKWIDDNLSNADQLSSMVSQLATAKSTLEDLEIVYKKIAPYIKNGKAYYELYQALDRVLDDVNAVGSYYDMMTSSGHLSISRMRSMTHMVQRLLNDVEAFTELANGIFNPDNSLSQAERLTKAAELEAEINESATALEEALAEDMATAIDEETTACALTILESAMSTDTATPAIEIDENQIITEALASKREEFSENTSAVSSGLVKSIFGLASVLIGALAALMIAWGYARYVKTGERQHQDALWKVFAGLIFVLLLLQIVKAVLFDSGFVTIG